MKAVRDCYEEQGVQQYYEINGKEYRNPHEARVKAALRKGLFKWRPKVVSVLDLACGSGEVTLLLNELGISKVVGVDPYTGEAYTARTNFQDIEQGKLENQRFSLIVCSYALHLAKESMMPSLCMQLAMMSEQLIIISPHKQPQIKGHWGWTEIEELVVDRTHIRYFKSELFETNPEA